MVSLSLVRRVKPDRRLPVEAPPPRLYALLRQGSVPGADPEIIALSTNAKKITDRLIPGSEYSIRVLDMDQDVRSFPERDEPGVEPLFAIITVGPGEEAKIISLINSIPHEFTEFYNTCSDVTGSTAHWVPVKWSILP